MAQRFSGRARQTSEFYPTPPWVTRALLDHMPDDLDRRTIWEPACGAGDMVKAMRQAGRLVIASDLEPQDCFEAPAIDFHDFAAASAVDGYRDIVTNPPYGIQGKAAEEFIKVALKLTERRAGRVAMLLKPDFDSGLSRTALFRDCPAWSKRVVLLGRILWFEPVPDPVTGKISGPSENHCWFIWDWEHEGPATVAYATGADYGAKEWKGKTHERA